MSVEARITSLGLTLPQAPKPVGSYVTCVAAGNLLFLSGVLPFRDGKLTRVGRVGHEVSIEEGKEDAATVALNALSIVKDAIGSLDKIRRCVKLTGFVSCGEDFYRHPEVINGASDLLFQILGENGRHARAAVGAVSLPLNSPVEIDFIFEVAS
ncbi:RidA family protein [Candidatus Magnetomonas plexicatena]|uniref:RidA family protein n=1 Tax=Candidatus Magnetomonas plexicatena TaxID=2552947 RepID=UPI0011043C6E|nr:RidA family protein [Nitrospirales bacterium LBB_01]